MPQNPRGKIEEWESYLETVRISPKTNPLNIEDSTPVLYKYVSSERVFTCLPEVGDGTLRATQPSALNDPFECAVNMVFLEDDEEEGNSELSMILTSLNPNSPVSKRDVAEAKVRHGSHFLRELLSGQLSKRCGIVSFASDPRHLLMWAHYTVDGSGFAIGYDVTKLIRLSRGERRLRPVLYGPKPILIDGYVTLTEGNLSALLSYKNDHWEYEKEWRLIVDLNETIGTGHSDRHGQPINLLRIPNEAVVSVYYTERTPEEAVASVEKRLKDSNNRFRAKKPSKLVSSEYEYGYVVATG